MPLDGGHVTSALLSRHDKDIAGFIEYFCLLIGASVAVSMLWYVLLALAAPGIIFSDGPDERKAPPICGAEQAWLGAVYAATLAFYAFMIATILAAKAN